MRRELVMSGIGGQGIQLAAQVLARGALRDGLHVQLFGSYGGMMRGGNTDATLVVSDAPVAAPPTVDMAWSGFVMHHDYSEATFARLGADSLVVVDSTVFEGDLPPHLEKVTMVPATGIAIDIGRKQTAAMVMVGAYLGVTDLMSVESVLAAVPQSLPAYREKFVDLNQRAITAGFQAGRELATETTVAAK
ncbi:2-oxoacid:acceptor oxidoreductase family protein [Nocardioides sp.]|uniref:2-oxoacid:acceptor oxidoreductase family protein n=1 Tax=Nocardioides sp. TaxID=35761 RepID=UPI00356B4C73